MYYLTEMITYKSYTDFDEQINRLARDGWHVAISREEKRGGIYENWITFKIDDNARYNNV